MIYNTYICAMSGIGKAITTQKHDKDYDLLVVGFCTALRNIGQELQNEIQFIQFARTRIVFLPSQDQYFLAVHADNDLPDDELRAYLEEIRDLLNETHWAEIHNPAFFNEHTRLSRILLPIVQQCLTRRSTDTRWELN